MTPKQKAKQLVEKYKKIVLGAAFARESAIICVDEILAKHYDDWDETSDYWTQVKQELTK